VLLRLVDRLDGVGDHHIGRARHELAEHVGVVLIDGEAGIGQTLFRELLIGTPGVLDHAHAVLIDLSNRLEAIGIRSQPRPHTSYVISTFERVPSPESAATLAHCVGRAFHGQADVCSVLR
jgi:hypothetical protein